MRSIDESLRNIAVAFCEDLGRVGANMEYTNTFMGMVVPFHGTLKKRLEKIEDKQLAEDVAAVLAMPITEESENIIRRHIWLAQWPSKAWDKGSPVRLMILHMRKMAQARRDRENASDEADRAARMAENEAGRVSDMIASRQRSADASVARTRKSLVLLSMRHGVTHPGTGAG